MTRSPAIEVHQLSKQFGANEVLAPLDLAIPRGSIFALVGQNGAVTTTLIKLLLNMLEPSEECYCSRTADNFVDGPSVHSHRLHF